MSLLDASCIPLIVAESNFACEPVICVVARLVKDALSPMSIASIFKVPTAREPIVAESNVALIVVLCLHCLHLN